MRLSWIALSSLALPLMACSIDVQPGPADEPFEDSRPVSPIVTEPARPSPKPSPKPAPTPTTPAPTPAPQVTATHPEVVTVITRDTEGNGWFCTGTLISPTEVVTAAHCLDPAPRVSFQIVAENIAGKPRYAGLSAAAFGGPHEVVENPDLGIITLARPVPLPAYAELVDVTAEVDAGTVRAAALVRTAEDVEAPFAFTSPMSVVSTVALGYSHGFGTPMFSKGGDSGAALFLVENGAPTHKIIGIARQPEPSRALDHFTRVDAELLTWKAAR